MQLQLVNFEQSKALKDAGFDWATNHWYFYKDGSLHNGQIEKKHSVENWNGKEGVIGVRFNAPTVALALKWLWEVKGVYVTPVVDNSDSAVIYAVSIHKNLSHGKDTYPQMHVQIIRNSNDKNSHITYFDTHDLAESAGLDKGLKMI